MKKEFVTERMHKGRKQQAIFRPCITTRNGRKIRRTNGGMFIIWIYVD